MRTITNRPWYDIVSMFRHSIALIFTFSIMAAAQTPADLILVNGKIVTLDPAQPEVHAIAMRQGRIIAVGARAPRLAGPATRVIDLGGKLAIPGFIEGHGHFMGVGEAQMNLNLRTARNWDEIVAMVAEAAKTAKPGTWIMGRGFHQSKWDKVPQPNVQGFPVHEALSKVSPNNPVWLTHASGHASMVNAAALKAAEITAATPNPTGGEIFKDANGQPTGLLNERAQGLLGPAYSAYLSKRTAAEVEADHRRKVELAAHECIANGITTFEDAGSPFDTVDLIKRVASEGKLDLRMWMMLNEANDKLQASIQQYRLQDVAEHHLTVRAIKRIADGALGSRGAWMLEPYSDLPSSSGINTEKMETIRQTADIAIANGFQLCVHAIGDRTNREVLNIYQQTFAAHPDKRDLRWRIEHAQHLDPADIPRFGQLGVIAAMQGIHCTSDAPYVLLRLGAKRAEAGAYAWRSLLDSGAVVGNGTDAPVEEVNPIACFYASVTRRTKDGTQFYPKQCMTRSEALKSYTLSNAFAAFEDDQKGSLVAGKLADITVLSRDILTIPEEQIASTQVVYTIVGGKIVYQGK
jgi:predicted amidohydrolase YtcJ